MDIIKRFRKPVELYFLKKGSPEYKKEKYYREITRKIYNY